jgi:pheromone shutdown protein TraB
MNKNKGIVSLVGFVLAGTGFISIILSLIGAQLSFLVWLDSIGALASFLVKIVMILAGIIIIYLALTNFEGESSADDNPQ